MDKKLVEEIKFRIGGTKELIIAFAKLGNIGMVTELASNLMDLEDELHKELMK